MVNLRSSKKRLKLALRNRFQNQYYRSSYRTAVKRYLKELEVYSITSQLSDQENAHKYLNHIYRALDKNVKNNIIHKNTAARNKARFYSYLYKYKIRKRN